MNAFRFYIKLICYTFLFLFVLVLSIDMWISVQASSSIYSSIDSLPTRRIAIVPGTSKYIHRDLNPYYQRRIDAALSVYFANKSSKLLLSGDNAARNYNEP